MSQPSILWWQKYGTLGADRAGGPWRCSASLRFWSQINVLASNNAHQAGARQRSIRPTTISNSRTRNTPSLISSASRRDRRATWSSTRSFVSYFLYACEEAVRAFHSKREWQATCDYDLKGHLPFLCEKAVAEPVYLTTYSGDDPAMDRFGNATVGRQRPGLQGEKDLRQ